MQAKSDSLSHSETLCPNDLHQILQILFICLLIVVIRIIYFSYSQMAHADEDIDICHNIAYRQHYKRWLQNPEATLS